MAKTQMAVSTVSSEAINDDAMMAAMLDEIDGMGGLGMGTGDLEEIVEVSAESHVSEFELEAAVAGAERTEATLQSYAEQDETAKVSEMNLDVADAEVVGAPKAVSTRAPREPRTPSDDTVSGKLMKKTYGDVGMFILEPADAELELAEMTAHAKVIIDGADELPVKAGNKMQLLFGYLKNGGKLNEYLLRAFEVLARDGEITTGDEGSYIQAMTKPTDPTRKAFGLGTARSQVSQLGALLPYLKIATKETGKFVANPNSVILAAVSASLVV